MSYFMKNYIYFCLLTTIPTLVTWKGIEKGKVDYGFRDEIQR
jgi:hypothetical protein